jgi:hypothetical protein
LLSKFLLTTVSTSVTAGKDGFLSQEEVVARQGIFSDIPIYPSHFQLLITQCHRLCILSFPLLIKLKGGKVSFGTSVRGFNQWRAGCVTFGSLVRQTIMTHDRTRLLSSWKLRNKDRGRSWGVNIPFKGSPQVT